MNRLSAHPMAVLAVAFAAGILTARLFILPYGIYLAVFGLAAAGCLYAFIRGGEKAATVWLLLAFLASGATFAALERRSLHAADRVQRFYDEGALASGDPVEVTGVVERAPEHAPDGFYLRLKVESLRFREQERVVSGVVSLFAPVDDASGRAAYEQLELRHGARVRVMTALRRAENFRNPGVSPFTEYLEQRGFDATGSIKSALLVERLDDERVLLPLAWLYEWREGLLGLIRQRFTPETTGVLAASLLGNRHHLSRDAAERFRSGGTFHVLVISGLHISFIGLLALRLMRRITRRRAWQFAVSVSLLWAYAVAVGAEASVVRAALMFTVVSLAPVLKRRAASLGALGSACLALLVWRPGELFDPSFQLTFLSVLAIVVFAWPLLSRLREVGEWRPTGETPVPPFGPHWWRILGELLFWSQRGWEQEMSQSVWRCRLFKTRHAARLEQLRLQPALRYLTSVVLVSATVQVMLLPLLVLYFHRLSPASVLLNVVVGVLMAMLSFAALAALAVAEVSAWLSGPLVSLTEGLSWLMVHSVDPLARARVASMRLPEYSGAAASVYWLCYAPLVALAVALARWQPLGRSFRAEEKGKFAWALNARRAAFALTLLLVLIVWHPFSAGRPDGRLRVDFLDVGQGDAALLTMPDGTTLLVDGGGRASFGSAQGAGAGEDAPVAVFERDARGIGEAVVSEYLWWRGLDRVDYLLATHADADHIEGLWDVARNFRVRGAFVGRAPARNALYARLVAALREQGAVVERIARGDLLRFGNVTVEVLWPPIAGPYATAAVSDNNESVVLRVSYGERAFLLTGDIEHEAEAGLLATPSELAADVVKVAHHGSRTSSTEGFVRAARPSLAVVPVGRTSIYGHPHREVMERWRRAGTEVLTTGERGTITVSTDGRDLRMETFATQAETRP